MAYEELVNIFALLPGVAESSGKVYTWTSKPAEVKHAIEQISLLPIPDGHILINAITGQPFDLRTFIAEMFEKNDT